MSTKGQVTQIPMPGMPVRAVVHSTVNRHNIAQGQEVAYLGPMGTGPHYEFRGSVKRVLPCDVIVDMGTSGTWQIRLTSFTSQLAMRRPNPAGQPFYSPKG